MTQLSGKALKIARITWLALAVMTVNLFVMSIAPRFHELQQPCKQAGIECEAKLQLTPMET